MRGAVEVTAYELAARFIGLREYPGPAENNPQILAFLADAGAPHQQDETAWCGAFVGYVAGRLLGLPVPHGYAWARSWLQVGTPVDLEEARQGFDIVVLSRGEGGHVGWFSSMTQEGVFMLGGNQGDAVTVAPFPKSRVLGVRRLWDA